MAKPSRKDLNKRAAELGVEDPDKLQNIEAVEEAIAAAEKADAEPAEDEQVGTPPPADPPLEEEPEIDPDGIEPGTVLAPILHNGRILTAGEPVPKTLSDEAVETLRRHGQIS